MDRSSGIATVGGAGVATLATYAYVQHDAALKWGQSASTLQGTADLARDAAARALTDPHAVKRGYGFPPPTSDRWGTLADQIDFGYSHMGGSAGPNSYEMPAVGPLRRASGMSIEDGIRELETAATKATELERTTLKSTRGALIGVAALAAGTGLAWLASRAID